MEGGRGIAEKKGQDGDVVLQMSTNQEPFFTTQEQKDPEYYTVSKNSLSGSSPNSSNLELSPLRNQRLRIQTYTTTSSATSAEIAKQSPVPTPTPSKPPKIPTADSIARRKSFARSEFSKPKSRLVEPSYPNDVAELKEEKSRLANSSSPYDRSPNRVSVSTPKGNLKSAPITPKTPLIGSPGLAEEEEEDEEVYKTASLKVSKKMGKKWKVLIVFEFTTFICFVGLFVASLTVDKL